MRFMSRSAVVFLVAIVALWPTFGPSSEAAPVRASTALAVSCPDARSIPKLPFLEVGARVGGAAPVTAADPKIEVVFPHDALSNPQPVTQATLVNIGAYLFVPGTLNPVSCSFAGPVQLLRAFNSNPAQVVGNGIPVMSSAGGKNITFWEWNDVDVSQATDPLNKYYFSLVVGGATTNNANIWSHGEDARTIFPQQDVPTGVETAVSKVPLVDAKIEIVFPHDVAGNPQPVTQASLVNVGVDLFSRGTLTSVAEAFPFTVQLFRSLNNAPQQQVGTVQKTTVTTGGVAHPRWIFNDIDVSQAQDPSNKYYFQVKVLNVDTLSNVWSHGADARTIFPEQDTPTASCPP